MLLTAGWSQERTMGLMFHDSTRSYQGYTLFAPLRYRGVYLIDNQGRLVHSWDAPPRPDLSVYLLEDGSLLRTVGRSPTRSKVEILDWDGNVTWEFNYYSDTARQHHDVEMLPGGTVLIVASETKSRLEAIEAGRNPALVFDGVTPEMLIEVDTASGDTVWEWHSWDHLVQDFDSTKQNYGVVRDHPELVDVNFNTRDHPDIMHVNSVDYNEELDQVIISPRAYSEVWIIDHSTTTEEAAGHSGGRYGRGGDLLYRWGNPATYGRGDTARHRLLFQHDPHWIPDSLAGAGHLLVFNNGGDRVRLWSSVEEWQPPTDSAGFYYLDPDSTYGPDLPSWWYRDTVGFYSVRISGSQRMPNGNTLICSGTPGVMFEVTPDSEVVWKYINPVCSIGPMRQGEAIPDGANPVFRCYRYSADYPAFEGRNLTPGGPIELPMSVFEPPMPGNGSRGLYVTPTMVRQVVRIALPLFEAGDVEVTVYDCLGARAATVYEGRLAVGEHRLEWNTQNVAAGTYFCQVRVGPVTVTRRFTIAR